MPYIVTCSFLEALRCEDERIEAKWGCSIDSFSTIHFHYYYYLFILLNVLPLELNALCHENNREGRDEDGWPS